MKLVSSWLVPKGYAAITIYPFIFFRDKASITSRLINHEKIHLRQQIELLLVFFYLWYGIEYLCYYYKFRNWKTAYRSICFEREAYNNENDMSYLKRRKLFAYVRGE
nr:hypothetical protein [Tenacibaculum mesophilum]